MDINRERISYIIGQRIYTFRTQKKLSQEALAFEAERKELTHSDLRFSKERADRNACPWCEKRDLNPYGEIHTPLKRARLPVPPLSQNAWTL